MFYSGEFFRNQFLFILENLFDFLWVLDGTYKNITVGVSCFSFALLVHLSYWRFRCASYCIQMGSSWKSCQVFAIFLAFHICFILECLYSICYVSLWHCLSMFSSSSCRSFRFNLYSSLIPLLLVQYSSTLSLHILSSKKRLRS